MAEVDPIVIVEQLEKRYEENRVHALRSVSMQVFPRDFLAISGPSGSGKTTLLNMIGGLDLPDSGRVVLDGDPISELDERARTAIRREKIGFVFQQFHLVPVLNALENVQLPLEIMPHLNHDEKQRRARNMLERVGLAEMAHRRPAKLSGGQQQRVAVARALVKRPPLILADEPTANLDTETGSALIELMREMRDELGCAFVFSTHDPRLLDQAERHIRMVDGSIAA